MTQNPSRQKRGGSLRALLPLFDGSSIIALQRKGGDHALGKVRVLWLYGAVNLLRSVHAASDGACIDDRHGSDVSGMRPAGADLHVPFHAHAVLVRSGSKSDAAARRRIRLRPGGTGAAGCLGAHPQQGVRRGHR
jgi:hypothetical protein